MTDILTYLKTRRSIPIPALAAPAPQDEELAEILTIAARVPDHGKLAPWRFILIRGEAAMAIDEALAAIVEGREGPVGEARMHAESTRFSRSPLVIGVISTAATHVKIPIWEQQLSAGAVCMNLIHAAHAKGYAANWVTEWVAYDGEAKALLGIGPDEAVAGFMHVGTPGEPPSDRVRPVLEDIVTEAVAPVRRDH